MTEKTHQQNIQIEQNSENGCALLVLFYFDGRTVLFPTNRIEIELTGADALRASAPVVLFIYTGIYWYIVLHIYGKCIEVRYGICVV